MTIRTFFIFSEPAPRSQTYADVEYNRGKYTVMLHENFVIDRTLLKDGVRSLEEQINPHYPLLAWDPKGERLAVHLLVAGRVKLFVYDVARRYKIVMQDLPDFQQVQEHEIHAEQQYPSVECRA